jgi:hypothetical protein
MDNYGTCRECLPDEKEEEQTAEVRLARPMFTFPTCRMSRAHVVVS